MNVRRVLLVPLATWLAVLAILLALPTVYTAFLDRHQFLPGFTNGDLRAHGLVLGGQFIISGPPVQTGNHLCQPAGEPAREFAGYHRALVVEGPREIEDEVVLFVSCAVPGNDPDALVVPHGTHPFVFWK